MLSAGGDHDGERRTLVPEARDGEPLVLEVAVQREHVEVVGVPAERVEDREMEILERLVGAELDGALGLAETDLESDGFPRVVRRQRLAGAHEKAPGKEARREGMLLDADAPEDL